MSGLNKTREEWPDLLRLPLMLGVVMIHTYYPVNAFGNGFVSLQGRDGTADAIMFFISQVIGRLSVPVFFYFSGYFYYRQIGTHGVGKWLAGLRSRASTLLVPFLIWNFLTLCAFYVIQQMGASAGAASSTAAIHPADPIGALRIMLDNNGAPIAYQFWFIRDLMLCMALAIVTLWLTPKLFGALAFVVGVLWFLKLWPITLPTSPAVFFFLLGGAAYKLDGSLLVNKFPRWIVYGYAICAVAEVRYQGSDFIDYLHAVGILLGVASAYWLAAGIGRFERVKDFFIRYSGAAFFLFACHEPVLTIFKKLFFKAAAGSDSTLVILFAYGAPPVIVITLALLIWSMLRKTMPGVLGVLTGGR
ncbi:acyltransferase family protein [Duganella sp. FT94W]|uniref:Acyltransferase family protein n=1 Tax=Duganella lactea TaxID=2692173 RepID=A0ABW9VC43_9BURK|nr:acyltransferase family protein [Duganella lactea]MYM36492.1 acyltransferase family protein [Duganella lactea]